MTAMMTAVTCPSTPPSSSQSSGISSSSSAAAAAATARGYHRNPASPPPSRWHPCTPSSSSATPRRRRVRIADTTPPTSPGDLQPPTAKASDELPVTPQTPSQQGSRTIHLYSPREPSMPSSSSRLDSSSRYTEAPPLVQAGSSSSSKLTIKGNVTPSRASAFFAPRRRAATSNSAAELTSPRPSLAHLATPSTGHTSARRGEKRRRVDGSPTKHRPGVDRILPPSSHRLAAGSAGDSSSTLSTAVRPGDSDGLTDSDDSEDDEMGFWDDSRDSSSSRRRQAVHLSRGPLSPTLTTTTRRSLLPPGQREVNGLDSKVPPLSGSPSPSPAKPTPLVLRNRGKAGSNISTALAAMRCGAGGGFSGGRTGLAAVAPRKAISYSPAHSTFSSHPHKSLYVVMAEDGSYCTQPLCSAYAHSARSYSGGRSEWLAVGDNEGYVSLIDTSHDPSSDNYTSLYAQEPHDRAHPRWRATSGSLFALSWRYDDRFIATSGSDYAVKVWDTATAQIVNAFQGSRGTARTIEWDPNGNGNLLASAGRDGAIHICDVRVAGNKGPVARIGDDTPADDEGEATVEPRDPLLSLWSAHAPALRGKSRRSLANPQAPKGVTSILFHRHREHNIVTTGCADARIKLWDLRFAVAYAGSVHGCKPGRDPTATDAAAAPISCSTPSRVPFSNVDTNIPGHLEAASGIPKRRARKAAKPRKARPGSPSFVLSDCLSGVNEASADSPSDGTATPPPSEDPLSIQPVFSTLDLSMSVGRNWNARSHGISSIVADDSCSGGSSSLRGREMLWAACTDGRIYGVPYSTLEPGGNVHLGAFSGEAGIETLYHPRQLGNSLYNHLALCPEGRTLALGCNSGDVVLWDVQARTSSVLQRHPGSGNNSSTNNNRSGNNATASHGSGAHALNCEVNSLSWAYSSSGNGWKLASAGDDCSVRTWEMDRRLANEGVEGRAW